MDNLEQQINQALDDLEEFCNQPQIRVKATIKAIVISEQFKKITSMGKEVLPHIYRRFKNKTIEYTPILVLLPLVKDIVGDALPIPNEGIRGNVEGMYNYAIEWLEEGGYT